MNTYYKKKRYGAYILTTILVMILPFITLGGNHIFLLSFDKMQLHILGISFDMQELYVMPFLLIMLFVGIFLLTTMLGRAWCGWACPHTIFRVIYRDLIETKLFKLLKSTQNKQQKADLSTFSAKAKKAGAIFIWFILSFIAASNFLWYFVPPSDFFAYLADYQNHLVLVGFLFCITIFLTIEIIFVAENFCIYMCPYCRVQSVLYDNDTKTIIYDSARGGSVYKDGALLKKAEISGECVACDKCVRVCPTHIDIRKGLQLECINCLECADACSSIMDKFKKKSLISWNSTNSLAQNLKVRYFRGKTLGYIAVLCVAIIIAITLGAGKSTMLLNINRTAQSYKILENGAVENHYTMLFQNTSNHAHTYYFKVLGDENIKIKQPLEPFKIDAHQSTKRRVFLMTEKNLSKSDKKDTIIPIKIMAYSVDDENISVVKESIFVYPKSR
ncbi:cytochrome c oxidase accessory protein CcoG [Helicobacter sp. 23-1044]